MGCSVTCQSAAKSETGVVTVTFGDGSQKEYASLSDAYNDTFTLDSDVEHAKKWLIAEWLRWDPTGSNPEQFANGKTILLNAGSTPPIQML